MMPSWLTETRYSRHCDIVTSNWEVGLGAVPDSRLDGRSGGRGGRTVWVAAARAHDGVVSSLPSGTKCRNPGKARVAKCRGLEQQKERRVRYQ